MVVLGIILVCRESNLSLFDPRSTYSYIFAYYAPQLKLTSDLLSVPLRVSTLMGESLVVD